MELGFAGLSPIRKEKEKVFHVTPLKKTVWEKHNFISEDEDTDTRYRRYRGMRSGLYRVPMDKMDKNGSNQVEWEIRPLRSTVYGGPLRLKGFRETGNY